MAVHHGCPGGQQRPEAGSECPARPGSPAGQRCMSADLPLHRIFVLSLVSQTCYDFSRIPDMLSKRSDLSLLQEKSLLIL